MTSLSNAYLEGDDEHVALLHREEDGRLLIHRAQADFAVYFRVEDATPGLRREWRKDPLCRGYRVEGGWLRTHWRGWGARRAVVHRMVDMGIPTFEGDCSPVKRWLADHPDVTIQPPRRCYLDLETDSRVPIQKARKDGARVLVWCVVSDETGEHQEGVLEEDTDRSERELLLALYRVLAPFDQVAIWNGDDFDCPLLRARTKDRRIDLNIQKRWLWIDQMVLFERLNRQVAESGEEKQSYALNAVAQSQLGEGKDELDAKRTYEYWAAGGESREKLVRYCVRDTLLQRKIEQKVGYLAMHQRIAEICGLHDDSWALYPTAQMDAFILRLGTRRGLHFPTVLKDNEERAPREQYEGSYNKDPPERAGILQNVHVVDFSSMYPSIMVSWNMSPDTMVSGPVNGPIPEGMCRAPKTGVCFDTTRKGIVPEAIEYLLAKRAEWSRKRASLAPGTPEAHDAERWTNAFKVVPNSFYGAQGNEGCRFFIRAVAESVSTTGKWLSQKTEVAFEERNEGARVLYIDTDGLAIDRIERSAVEETTRWLNQEHYPALLAGQGCKANIVKLAYEKEYDRVVFCGAKNFIGRFVHYKGKLADPNSRPEIKGIAYKRGDQTRLTMVMQAEAIGLLMGGMRELECECGHRYALNSSAKQCPGCARARSSIARVDSPTEDLPAYEEMAARWRERLLEGELPIEDVQTVKGLSKPLAAYAVKISTKGKQSSQPPHVRVGKILAARGEDVGEGTKVAYFVVDADATPQAVAPACDYDGTCDRRYLWGRVWTPTRQLLESAFPLHDWSRFDPPRKERKALPAKSERSDLVSPRSRKVNLNQGGLFR
jgi:DNA polymerase elongation subunit (family B)